ncbi:MAG TPA: c-type cytochrome [Candidatus Acidoferrum sp.]|nr:c-type cytochrome [Candidatus Acidoferrum sp.]
MKRSTLLIIAGLVLLGLAIAVAASVLHDGLSAKAAPTALETIVARNARHLAIPSNARAQQNPVLDSPEVQRDARLHFADHCAACHANDGSGHTLYGEGLYPKPPDLRLQLTQDLTDGELFWIIENGVRFTGMPGFSSNGNHSASGNHSGVQDSWQLVHFIRHLPHLTAAERLEMERYNPKGPEERAEEQEENDFLGGATSKKKTDSQMEKPE